MQTPKVFAMVLCIVCVQSVSASLVGYWSFDEGGGTNITDLSGNGNNGTIVNLKSNTWTAGISGSALYFDGTTGSNSTYVLIPDAASLRITSAITFAAWVRLDNTNTDAPILDKEGPPTNQCYWFGARGSPANKYDTASPGNFGVLLNLAGNTGTDGWSLWGRNQGKLIQVKWVHLAVTWDGATVRYYTNGVQLPTTASFSGTLNTNSTFLAIGENSEWHSTAFQGVIDEARLYNNALSSSQVAALAVAPNPLLSINFATNVVQVGWLALTNVGYQPQWATNLQTGVWNNIGSLAVGAGTSASFSDSTSTDSYRFYTVLTIP